MLGPPSGTASPWSVAGSAVKARLGTWQVPQLWLPEADKLVSKKSAFPATAAADGAAGAAAVLPALLPPPPQPKSVAPAITTLRLEIQPQRFLNFIRGSQET